MIFLFDVKGFQLHWIDEVKDKTNQLIATGVSSFDNKSFSSVLEDAIERAEKNNSNVFNKEDFVKE